MKILFTILGKYPHIGGVSTHLESLSTGLQKIGNSVKIISNTSNLLDLCLMDVIADLPSFLISFFNTSESIFYRITQREKILSLRLYKNLKIGTNRFDVINSEDIYSFNTVYKILQKLNLKIPLILTLHGYPLQEYESNYDVSLNKKVSDYIFNQEKKAYEKASLIITVDNRIRNYVLSVVKRENVFVIKNFVNVDEFYPCSEQQKYSLRDKLGLPKDKILIFCPRRLVPKNGVIYTVKMATILKKRFPEFSDFLILIAGDGPQKEIIKNEIKKYSLDKQFKLIGAVAHQKIKEYYWSSDIVIIPSVPHKGVEEATSISALEGMACGIPVIASNIGGLKEIINNGETGFLVEPKNSYYLAQKVVTLIENKSLLSKITKQSRKFIETEYSHISRAKEFEKLYKLII